MLAQRSLKNLRNMQIKSKPTVSFVQRRLISFTGLLAFLVSFSACVTSRNTSYFQSLSRDTTISNFVSDNFENKIQPGDKLAIAASSLDAREDAIFNQGGGESGEAITTGPVTAGGFLVRPDGTILLHRLGVTKVSGLTRKELSDQLQKQLSPYMKDVIVAVSFLNHKITVLGAVSTPQVLPLTSEQMPLIDAIVKSGDLTVDARGSDIMVIREEGNEKKVKHLSLEDASIFNSTWYYVRPNDIIYVTKDTKQAEKEARQNSLRTTLSLVASGVGLLIIILDRIL